MPRSVPLHAIHAAVMRQFAVVVGPDQLGDVADRRGLSLGPSTLGG
jgi:hypothetical protein